jgi:hypothetical protein
MVFASLAASRSWDGRRGKYDGNKVVGVPGYQLHLGLEWDMPFAREMTLSARHQHRQALHRCRQFPEDRRLDAFRRRECLRLRLLSLRRDRQG